MRLIKKKKGDTVGKMVGLNGYQTVEVQKPGISIEIGSRIAFISWEQLEAFKKSKSRELEMDAGV